MNTVKIRQRGKEYQVFLKQTNRIVFRGKTMQECFNFIGDSGKYIFEATQEKGVHYVY